MSKKPAKDRGCMWLRRELDLQSGCVVRIAVNQEGDVIIRKVDAKAICKPDRFEAARGKADIKCRSDDLMALLREG
jgi:hypothetical protein